MTREKLYVQTIQRCYPKLAVDTAYLNQEGQYNDVLIVNEALVFRFAKTRPAVETLKREIAILQGIRNYITLAIPEPLYWHVALQRIDETFMGYELIRGQPLWCEKLRTITEDTVLDRFAQQLTTFLQELHRVPVSDAISLELPVSDTRDQWVDLYDRIKKKLFVYMSRDARRRVADHFECFLGGSIRYEFQPVLRHGDFGASNIMYDPSSTRITGIIDFGATSLGDPAVDFAGLLTMGEGFYGRCAAFYPEMERARHRVDFYHGTFALQEALFGIEHGDANALHAGLRYYK